MTKQAFKNALRAELVRRYGIPGKGIDSWACDESKLDKFMLAVHDTLTTSRNQVNIDSESFRAAWRAIGGKGKPTYKALRALSD